MILRKQTGEVKGTVVLALSLIAADEVRSWTVGGQHPFFDFEIPKETSKEILGGEKGFLFGFPEVTSRGQVRELLNKFNRTLLEGTLSVLLRESGVSVRNVSSLADEIYHNILHGEIDGTVEVSETKEVRYSVDRPEGDLPVLVVELSVADKEVSVLEKAKVGKTLIRLIKETPEHPESPSKPGPEEKVPTEQKVLGYFRREIEKLTGILQKLQEIDAFVKELERLLSSVLTPEELDKLEESLKYIQKLKETNLESLSWEELIVIWADLLERKMFLQRIEQKIAEHLSPEKLVEILRKLREYVGLTQEWKRQLQGGSS